MCDYDDRLREKDDGAYQRYRRLRAVTRLPGGRHRLRAIRRATRPPAPATRNRRPSLAMLFLFALVLAALVVVERAEGALA